jgi:hypothetical protein
LIASVKKWKINSQKLRNVVTKMLYSQQRVILRKGQCPKGHCTAVAESILMPFCLFSFRPCYTILSALIYRVEAKGKGKDKMKKAKAFL